MLLRNVRRIGKAAYCLLRVSHRKATKATTDAAELDGESFFPRERCSAPVAISTRGVHALTSHAKVLSCLSDVTSLPVPTGFDI